MRLRILATRIAAIAVAFALFAGSVVFAHYVLAERIARSHAPERSLARSASAAALPNPSSLTADTSASGPSAPSEALAALPESEAAPHMARWVSSPAASSAILQRTSA